VKVLGKQALGMFLVGTNQMVGKYISEHDENCKQIGVCNGWW
jgi:hypothetical protein